jgi:hypothetical protein
LAAFSLVAAFFREGHGGERLGIVFAVEVSIDVPGVKGGVKGAKTRLEAETLLSLAHEREEIADIAPVKRLGHLGQDELAPARHLDRDDTGAIAPANR